VGNAVFTAMLCGVPAVAVTLDAAPALLVRLKFAAVNPVAPAVTLYVPETVFAVNVVAVARPLALVVVVVVFVPLANVPLAPLAGAVNVTDTPLTGLLCESVTVA
jgi:hypothetical protein